MLVVPRLVCPSCRWIMFSGTPSRASSSACACRSWCGANRRRIPARAATRRNSPRTAAADHGRPRSGAVDNAEQGSHRELGAHGQPWPKLFPAHPSIPTSRRRPPLPWRTCTDPRRWSRSSSLNASASWMRSPRAPEHHDHRTQPPSVAIGDRVAHYRDDLIDGGRVRRVAHPLVARRAASVVSRAGSPASGAGPPHRARTWWSWDLLGSDSGYGRCPTPPAQTSLPLALVDRASARAQAAASRRPSLVHSGSPAALRSRFRVCLYAVARLRMFGSAPRCPWSSKRGISYSSPGWRTSAASARPLA
jgi:hypothetical protein